MSFNYVGKAIYYSHKHVVWGLPQGNFHSQKIPRKAHPEGTSLNYKTGIQDKEEGPLSGGSSSPLTVEEADALLLW